MDGLARQNAHRRLHCKWVTTALVLPRLVEGGSTLRVGHVDADDRATARGGPIDHVYSALPFRVSERRSLLFAYGFGKAPKKNV